MSSRKVLIEADARNYVGYFGLDGQIDRGYPLEERPKEPPTGSVYERDYVLLKEAVDENGKPIEMLDGFLLRAGPRKFLRGCVVHMPPALQEFASVLGARLGVECIVCTTAVIVRNADGTEVSIPLNPDDVPPPAGVSDHAVGESPEERRMTEMVSEAAAAYAEGCQDDLDLEDEEEFEDDEDPVDADCFGDGGGHPTIPLPPGRDDGSSVA